MVSIFLAILGIRYVVKGMIHFVEWIIQTVPKLDAVVIVALITGAVSLISVLISSLASKIMERNNERRIYLAKKREEPYCDFINMMYKIMKNTKDKGSYTNELMLEDVSKFSEKITLWGSAKVVNKWMAFKQAGFSMENPEKQLFLLEEIMNEMRKDLGVKKVKKGNLLGFFIEDIQKNLKKVNDLYLFNRGAWKVVLYKRQSIIGLFEFLR